MGGCGWVVCGWVCFGGVWVGGFVLGSLGWDLGAPCSTIVHSQRVETHLEYNTTTSLNEPSVSTSSTIVCFVLHVTYHFRKTLGGGRSEVLEREHFVVHTLTGWTLSPHHHPIPPHHHPIPPHPEPAQPVGSADRTLVLHGRFVVGAGLLLGGSCEICTAAGQRREGRVDRRLIPPSPRRKEAPVRFL